MRFFSIILSAIAITITVLPIFPTSLWWVRIFDFPRMQIFVMCLICIGLILLFLKKRKLKLVLLALVTASSIYQFVYIVPYTPLYPVQTKSYTGTKTNSSFTIMEANIRMDNKEVDDFLELVEEQQPDILIITEPSVWWENKILKLDKQYPYSIKKALDNTYGLILYSRLTLKDEKINFLVEPNIPSFYTKIILNDKREFDLYTIHPEPPKPGTSTADRDTEILIIGKKIRESGRPAIVVGDLNDVGWSNTSKLFRKYSRMVDPREGRGLFNTYSVFIPFFRYPLDHFFISEHFSFVKLERLKAIGSDHFPVMIELNLDSMVKTSSSQPEADHSDKKEVKEILNQER